ncbi:predicted protein [Naegleria gruberi]|uniref:Predicted protein n=1 Tax=Naegleria gruberi TaxID=5762 RepID=D2W0Q1_NAEGR|nr:uncharacterized protein NAEGRDRAFT_74939 [Naegleria gruberi]EFC37332.1 predicted protein [Naegleria gruberi]|eukprot:XP_002670076.1 predicted protein [Naegleria gruberi strain NEG-M]
MDITVKESKSTWSHTFPQLDTSLTVLKFRELIVENHNQALPSDVWLLSEVTIINGGKFLKNDDETLADAKVKASVLVYLKKQPASSSAASSTSTTATTITSNSTSSNTVNNNSTTNSTVGNNSPPPVQQQQSIVDKQLEQARRLEKIKLAALEMAKRSNGGDSRYEQYHFVLEDQNGNKIRLPESEREALVVGMILQQKSEEFIKKKQYREAFDCLQVADEAFKKLPIELLSMIDNYATLLIDIVWVMYKLKDPTMLFDAIQRLQLAEKILKASHGENLERLMTIQGGKFAQFPLYCKLSLLKGIICLEVDDKSSAKVYLEKANQDYKKLVLDPTLIEQVVGMGFTYKEARKALKECQGNVENALTAIIEKRELAKRREMEEFERKQDRKKQLAFGNTKNGKLVDMKLLKALHSVFSQLDEETIAEAIKMADNDELVSTQLLCDPQTLEELAYKVEENIHHRYVDYEQVYNLCMLGFEMQSVVFALKKAQGMGNRGKIEEIAVDMIINGKAKPKIQSKDLDDIAAYIIKKSTSGTLLSQPATTGESASSEVPNSQDSMLDEGEDDQQFPPEGASSINAQEDDEYSEEDDEDEQEPNTPLDDVFKKKQEMEDIIDEEIVESFYNSQQDDDYADEMEALNLYLSKLN